MIGALAAGVLGAGTWSLAEHLIHENLGHRFARSRRWGSNPFSVEHVRHHATTTYFAATSKKAIAACITTAAVAPLAIAVAGPTLGTAYTVGFVSMYVGYELLHRRAHTHAPRTRYGAWLRKHHFHHHFHDSNVNHGVSSPLWDVLRGTLVHVGVVDVPAKHAMPWLVDAATGEVRPEFQADYRLVKKKRH
jgi:sterol desaturase/sphingolipid hydroxylase (fatty acid hydroxylase superfamily)